LGKPCTLWADTQVYPYWKLRIKVCIQKTSQGAIGVTNPCLTAGIATGLPGKILHSLKLSTVTHNIILINDCDLPAIKEKSEF
jgi:hypothetical protein